MKIVIKLKQLLLDNIMPPVLIISLLCEFYGTPINGNIYFN